ncbi:hypothetical protein BELL_0065g00120 [Botrytis elliptica]|uniref:Uncharacterized protein n=1 Tax=Botrytis elliptica TaxID=278938 RepID=A0A4Z1JX63_9HELO|nr:hypothetical protein BELL_0065g00120 [Botrytis elliptica]
MDIFFRRRFRVTTSGSNGPNASWSTLKEFAKLTLFCEPFIKWDDGANVCGYERTKKYGEMWTI